MLTRGMYKLRDSRMAETLGALLHKRLARKSPAAFYRDSGVP